MLGALADRVKGFIPESYHALTNSSYFGETLLQEHIDDIKFKFFATVVSFSLEATTYDRYVLRFLGKVCTLNLIHPARDYWMNQITSENTTGTDEQITFPDRLAALEETYRRLYAEVEAESDEFESFISTIIRKKSTYPGVNTSSDDLRTTSPTEFVRDFNDVSDLSSHWGVI